MVLSVIIVNYNVRHFLEQCLCSVQKAIAGLEAEVWVIDNNSSDNSRQYLQPLFPSVRFVFNTQNVGFAKACNQGLTNATGRYILFLNPDTIVAEESLTSSIAFLEKTPEAGALGIRMLDGNGQFLKESKRAFPSPVTSLYKLFGLAALFPRSSTFARYHLGHFSEQENHEVDVLAGAYMLIKKEVLDKTGGFDETFFMYGEDVDLSYRIQQAGYKNYYFAGSSIIHFKGESTKKGSMNYVRMFYKAMSIFVQKHYGSRRAGFFSFFIQLAIWIRAGLSALTGFIRRIGLPLLDAALIIGSFWLVKWAWSSFVRPDIVYEYQKLWISFPAFAALYLLAAYYAGLYDRWYKRSELISSTLVATVLLLAAYSLLPEHYRFSRGIILFGAILSFLLISTLRYILVRRNVLTNNNRDDEHTTTLIAGTPEEYSDTVSLLKQAGLSERVLGRIAVQENDLFSAAGQWKELPALAEKIPFREVIICEGVLTFTEIINSIQALPTYIRIKIRAAGSHSIVGSHSKDDAGEALSPENGFHLSEPHYRRLKRLLDISISLLLLLTFPVHFLLVRKPLRFLNSCLQVLAARKTWVGYVFNVSHLPSLRPGVIAGNGLAPGAQQQLPAESLQLLDYWYARDYTPSQDIKLLIKTYRKLGG